ncbi:MAG TPA: M50 family metallopeptidase [Thermoleophilaceae bacterium]|nr:M50 family metallopeptidase [Thermoleophilaceae bacterium]
MSWFLAFVGFALLIMLHEAGHFAAAKAVGMRAERFALFFPPFIWRKQVGETEYALGAIPLGGYVKISGMNPDQSLPEDVRDRAYHAQPVWKRIVVIVAGPLVNVVLALVLLFAYFAFVGQPRIGVDQVQKGFPATEVLKPGDRLLGVDGIRADVDEREGLTRLSQAIAAHRCAEQPPVKGCKAERPATLLIERDGEQRTVQLTPVYDPEVKRMRVGFTYGQIDERRTFGPGEALTNSLDRFWFVTWETIKLPARLFDAEKREEVSSVVGGYEVTRQTILERVPDVVIVLAIISLSLAIINLFPFLPLDGGHIFWALVEKVRRRPVPLAVMERASVVGFLLVILVFFIGLSNDIDRLSGEGFQVR